MNSIYTQKQSSYVLDDITSEQIDGEVKKLKSDIGSNINLSLENIEFKKLKKNLLRLMKQDEAGADSEEFSSESLEIQCHSSFLPAIDNHYSDVAEMIQSVEPIVDQRSDLDLTQALQEFKKKTIKITKNSKSNPEQMAMHEYFLLFSPTPLQFKEEKTSVLIRFLKSLTEMLLRFAAFLKKSTEEIWEVLKNPDAYYLRLRGELHEFQRNHPNSRWVEYLLLIPDIFRLFVRLLLETRVSIDSKLILAGALAYLISPIDFIPEGIVGPIGYIDDALVLCLTLADTLQENRIGKGLLMEHWAGTEEILDNIIHVSKEFSENIDFFGDIHTWMQKNRNPTPA